MAVFKRPFAILTLLTVPSLVLGDHIDCYVCSTLDFAGCSDGDLSGSFDLERCDEPYDVCFKERIEDPDGKESYRRGCAVSAEYDDKTDQCGTSKIFDTKTTLCLCEDDKCNAATTSANLSGGIFMFSLIVSAMRQ